jgi:hypothetical protein
MADLGDRRLADLGHDGERIEVRRLALVGAHAGRGVALEVLDRDIALAGGEVHIRGGDVVLEVDEMFGATAERTQAGDHRHHPAGAFLDILGGWGCRRLAPGARRGVAGGDALGQAVG